MEQGVRATNDSTEHCLLVIHQLGFIQCEEKRKKERKENQVF